jgi:hypothetical protein
MRSRAKRAAPHGPPCETTLRPRPRRARNPLPSPQAAEAEEVARLVAEARSTPKGARKELGADMYKGYHPAMVGLSFGARGGGRGCAAAGTDGLPQGRPTTTTHTRRAHDTQPRTAHGGASAHALAPVARVAVRRTHLPSLSKTKPRAPSRRRWRRRGTSGGRSAGTSSPTRTPPSRPLSSSSRRPTSRARCTSGTRSQTRSRRAAAPRGREGASLSFPPPPSSNAAPGSLRSPCVPFLCPA